MSNRIFIQDYNRLDDVMDFPLMDDVTPEFQSQFGSFSDVVPKFSDLLDFGTIASAGTTGGVDESVLASKNLFDVPRWKKTDPIKYLAKLIFHTKDDPQNDVFIPMKNLISYSILTYNEDKTYSVPGISLASVKSFQSDKGESQFSKNAKLLSITIPGIIALPVAIIEKATPTYSKEITESGFPLWGQLDIQVTGVFPANTKNLDDAQIAGQLRRIPPGL